MTTDLSSALVFYKNMSLKSTMSYSEFISITSFMPMNYVTKLRLFPDKSINGKVEHLLSVIKYAKELTDLNYKLIAIESSVDLGYVVEADLIVETMSKNIIYFDITNTKDANILSMKMAKAKSIASQYSIDYRVYETAAPFKVNIKVDLELNDKNIYKDVYKFLDKSALEPWNMSLYKQYYSDVIDIIAQNSLETNLEVTNKVKGVQGDITSNSCESVCKTLNKTSDPIMINAIGKLAHFASILDRKVIKLYPASIGSEMIKSKCFISLLLRANCEPKFYTVSRDLVLTEGKALTLGNFCIEPHVMLTFKKLTSSRFIIYFNADYLDPNFANSIARDKHARYKKRKTLNFWKDVPEASTNFLRSLLEDYDELTQLLGKSNPMKEGADIFSKIATIISVDSDMALPGSVADLVRSNAMKCVAICRSNLAGAVISHEYEVAKTFAASLRGSPQKNEYHIGKNGIFDSYTLVKRNSTQDSFSSSFYQVFFFRDDNYKIPNMFVSEHTVMNDVYVTKARSYNRNTLAWAIKVPFVFFNVFSWHMEFSYAAHLNIADLIASSFIYSKINRDPFAQISELTRYMFMSATSNFSESSALLQKYDMYIPKEFTELVYIARQFKMLLNLRYFTSNHLLSTILETDSQGNSVLKCAMPHMLNAIADNSFIISSFYICNIYNKFKYNEAVSAAICMESLLDEEEIYRSKLNESKVFVVGLTNESLAAGTVEKTLRNSKARKAELDYIKLLSKLPNSRFQCSILFMFVAARLFATNKNIDNILSSVSKSALEACTMRGGMSGDKCIAENQNVRAASCILEGILQDLNINPENFNNSKFSQIGLTDLNKAKDVSIIRLKALQYNTDRQYCYRVVHKDQKGHREISILNYNMRIGTLFVEAISKANAQDDDIDILNNPDKSLIVQKTLKLGDTKDIQKIYDTNDQKRWGPNALMHSFAAIVFGLYSDMSLGLSRLMVDTLIKMQSKQAKFADEILELMNKDITFNTDRTIGRVISKLNAIKDRGIYHLTLEWGMCQGILHQLSSTVHSLMCRSLADVIFKISDKVYITSFVTSDDNLREISISKTYDNSIYTFIRMYLNAVLSTSNLFNIVRNMSKSVINENAAEFNSVFYFKNALAVPTLKHRVAYIDAGTGTDYVQDVLSAISSGSNYISAGGTYVGSFIVSVTNVTICLEQYKGWFKIKEQNKGLNRSVFLGGIPVIEPASTLISGPLSALAAREHMNFKVTMRTLSKIVVSNVMNDPTSISQTELLRGASSISKKDFMFMIPTSVSGLITLSRPLRKDSRFMSRHNLTEVSLDIKTLLIDKYASTFNNFMLGLMLGIGSTTYEELLYTNSIIQRFTEPWINIENAKYKVSSNTILSKLYVALPTKVSQKQLDDFYMSKSAEVTLQDIYSQNYEFNSSIRNIASNALTDAFQAALKITENLFKVVKKYEDSIPKIKFQICKATLLHSIIIDTKAVKPILIKSIYTGENVPSLNSIKVTEETINDMRSVIGATSSSFLDSIKISDIVVNALNKYVRTMTKCTVKSEHSFTNAKEVLENLFRNCFDMGGGFNIKFKLGNHKNIINFTAVSKRGKESLDDAMLLASNILASQVLHKYSTTPTDYYVSEFDVIDDHSQIIATTTDKTNVVYNINKFNKSGLTGALISLFNFAGDVTLSENTFKTLSRGSCTCNYMVKFNDRFTKVTPYMHKLVNISNNLPAFLVTDELDGIYSHTFFILTNRNTKNIKISLTRIVTKAKSWIKDVCLALEGVRVDSERITIDARESIRVKFINRTSEFRVIRSSTTPFMGLTMKNYNATIPLIVFPNVNDSTLANIMTEKLSKLEAENKSASEAINSDKISALIEESLYGVDKDISKRVFKAINRMSIPADFDDIREIGLSCDDLDKDLIMEEINKKKYNPKLVMAQLFNRICDMNTRFKLNDQAIIKNFGYFRKTNTTNMLLIPIERDFTDAKTYNATAQIITSVADVESNPDDLESYFNSLIALHAHPSDDKENNDVSISEIADEATREKNYQEALSALAQDVNTIWSPTTDDIINANVQDPALEDIFSNTDEYKILQWYNTSDMGSLLKLAARLLTNIVRLRLPGVRSFRDLLVPVRGFAARARTNYLTQLMNIADIDRLSLFVNL
jgi:hypothetical protein